MVIRINYFTYVGASNEGPQVAGLTIAITLVHFLVDVVFIVLIFLQRYKHPKGYIMRVICVKFVREPLYALSLILAISVFIVSAQNGCMTRWQWHVGLICVLYGWIYFVFLTTKLPLIGVYSIIFITIVKTFAKLVLFSLLLIFASTTVFLMIFFNPQASVSIN